jgi:2-oxo-4-hydroxy-4-carboxy-5-ureidoimidazoline decarboxylase
MLYSLSGLNQMSQADFIKALGAVFEATPEIAAQVWEKRPFDSVQALHQHMVAVVQAMPPLAQLKLIQAHPDLGSRVRMAEASVAEQSQAGLTNLTAEEYERFQALNQSYRQTFGFPFIMAVAGQTKGSILASFSERLTNSPDAEKARALQEIEKIAWLRLQNWVQA